MVAGLNVPKHLDYTACRNAYELAKNSCPCDGYGSLDLRGPVCAQPGNVVYSTKGYQCKFLKTCVEKGHVLAEELAKENGYACSCRVLPPE